MYNRCCIHVFVSVYIYIYRYICKSKSKSEVSLILRQAGCLEGPLLFHLYLTGQVFFYWER